MALLWKMICNLGDPMSLRHPVAALSRASDKPRLSTFREGKAGREACIGGKSASEVEGCGRGECVEGRGKRSTHALSDTTSYRDADRDMETQRRRRR